MSKMVKQCYFKQKYTLQLVVALKTAYSCCFSLGGNQDFPEFLQKRFLTSMTGYCWSSYGPPIIKKSQGLLRQQVSGGSCFFCKIFLLIIRHLQSKEYT